MIKWKIKEKMNKQYDVVYLQIANRYANIREIMTCKQSIEYDNVDRGVIVMEG